MIWLVLVYLALAIVNFLMSLDNIETWAYRGKETKMQKVIRWICITIVNPAFSVMYWGCWIFVFYWQKKDSKNRRNF